ncbi:hypothetical protein GH714_019390 [Hevea brasiliensis]|uniref:Retrotransposon gag domain-containing protein n=1 Tax=Hevea brasiliensis TaxID=3981 RepID=A0A6A6N6M0_HEVBR|nr:hypothetical protein GH714_019390 [Hevea brasiliensis]
MPPKAVGGRGRGANRGRSVHRVQLANVGRPHRDPIAAPPPPEEVADQELPEGRDEHDVTISHDVVSGAYSTAAPSPPVPPVATVAPPVTPVGTPPIAPTDAPPIPLEAPAIPFQLNIDLGAFVAQIVTAAVTAKPKDPWEVVDRARRLGAYDFEGSSDANVADKWLKSVIQVFDLMKLTNADRMDNIHGLLQGKADSWFDGIHHRIGADLTWDRFMIEFRQEYLTESYRKESKMPSLNILPSEEAKCDSFRQGLHVGIRSSMTWFRGSNFRELVEAALNIEKVRQEEKEYEQKMSRKHGQSSSQGFRERPAKRGGSSS